MSESDLTKICQAIPTSASGSISTQANAILKGITGEDVEFDIQTGGNQPQLFSPTVTLGVNSISTSTNTDNGAFNCVTTLMVDGNIVSSPYVVLASDDGKTYDAYTSGQNFQDSSHVTGTVIYTDPETLLISINNDTDQEVWIGGYGSYPTCVSLDNLTWGDGCIIPAHMIARLYFRFKDSITSNDWNNNYGMGSCLTIRKGITGYTVPTLEVNNSGTTSNITACSANVVSFYTHVNSATVQTWTFQSWSVQYGTCRMYAVSGQRPNNLAQAQALAGYYITCNNAIVISAIS